MSFRLRTAPMVALVALLLVVPAAYAQYDDDDEDDGIRQTVARLSWFEGEASLNRGDDPDDWQLAAINYPLTLGDRLWVGRDGRAELQLLGGTLFLAPESELGFLDLTRDVRQLSLSLGTATFRIRAFGPDEVFEVATPNASVTFESPGVYRIDVDEEGNTRFAVSQGRARVAAAGGQVLLERGERMRVYGLDRPDYDFVRIGRADAWDRWVERRVRRFRSVRSASYVHPDVCGIDDLDAWGAWETNAEYGSVWYPRVATAGWEPYRSGRWIWRDPWGWTWLSDEPWGWAPYHHGRWVRARGRWAWVPAGPRGRAPGWFPAIVGFVGGGPGWGVSASGGGFVGWFPLAPREPFHPWWYHSRRRDDAPGHRYAYRDRVVVVPRDVFVRGHFGDRDVVRDARVLRDFSSSPVLRGPIPVVPTRDAIRTPRGSIGDRISAAPPRRAVERSVVTRRAVPPAPATFDRKVDIIRERGGEPIQVDESRRLSSQEPRGERPVMPVRSATRDEVVLSPRGGVAPARRPEPLPLEAPRPATTYGRPTPRPADSAPALEPTRPPRRVEEEVRPVVVPRGADTPPRRDEAPETRPTRPAYEAMPTPAPRFETAPTPLPRPRYEGRPTPAPRFEGVPTPRPRPGFEDQPTPAPRFEAAPTPTARPRRELMPPSPRIEAVPTPAPRAEAVPTPERRIAPVVPRVRMEPPEPVREAPREAVRARPAERVEETKPAEGRPVAPKPTATPTRPPQRRVSPEPG